MKELTTYENTNIVAVVFGSMFGTIITLFLIFYTPKSWVDKVKSITNKTK